VDFAYNHHIGPAVAQPLSKALSVNPHIATLNLQVS
jgi:hypothetical protein